MQKRLPISNIAIPASGGRRSKINLVIKPA